MKDYDAPAGYHYEWLPASNWRIGGGGYKCRFLRCPNRAVAALQRRHGDEKFIWWHYCADHMYGRKIENGIVIERRLVKNVPELTV